ncbi:alpha/beta fold hydrolase [Paenibacillus allorhizosphaerae]|uniref:AB hydrolase superfamily protein YvaM n=1 Tax=Paenibacillus allorhizosphaerae TaxID=2849866 RepID=A0ABN7TVI2_9BACL|nr:alpha/beta hydrolase [Paenibacillus allorhizosphaerae]CAG7653570.1 AB hydrolase superfamily protein YvaM [Paenibacillus allorhizosphaerae]
MPFAKINGVALHYRIKGAGVPIVFIHPPLLAGNVFHRQLTELSGRFQVIVPDLRGHGQSEAGGRSITYSLLAEDIVALLDDLEIKKAYLCGYSTGGSVALEAMLAYPERFYGGILVSAMSEVGTFRVKSEIWAAVRLTRFRAKRLTAAAIALGNADRMDTFKRLYNAAMQGQIKRLHEYFQCSLIYNCTNRLHEIESPILLLYGEKDKLFRHHGKLLQRELRNDTFRTVKKVAHQIPTKAAEDMNGHIRDWIDRQDPWRMAPRDRKESRYDAFLVPEAYEDEQQPELT